MKNRQSFLLHFCYFFRTGPIPPPWSFFNPCGPESSQNHPQVRKSGPSGPLENALHVALINSTLLIRKHKLLNKTVCRESHVGISRSAKNCVGYLLLLSFVYLCHLFEIFPYIARHVYRWLQQEWIGVIVFFFMVKFELHWSSIHLI